MVWFKKKTKKLERATEENSTKSSKKIEKKLEKAAALQQKVLQKSEQLVKNTANIEENVAPSEPVSYTLPQLYNKQKVVHFIPITLLMHDCLNSFCLEKLRKILDVLPKNTEIFLESPYLVDKLQYAYPQYSFHTFETLASNRQVSGHFVANVQLTTIDVQFLINSIKKIYQYPYEVYLFYNTHQPNAVLEKAQNLWTKVTAKFARNRYYTQSQTAKATLEQPTQQLLEKLAALPYLSIDKLFLIYTSAIANKILPHATELTSGWQNNFLPLVLNQNICFLGRLPQKQYSKVEFHTLENEIKQYLKSYQLFKAEIRNDRQHILFYKVIESNLLLYYANLIVTDRLDRLEKFESALQKKYLVFYIGLEQHSPYKFIKRMRKKGYKKDFIIQYSAKRIIAAAKKACK